MQITITLTSTVSEALHNLCSETGSHPEQLVNRLLEEDLLDILESSSSLAEFMKTRERNYILSNTK